MTQSDSKFYLQPIPQTELHQVQQVHGYVGCDQWDRDQYNGHCQISVHSHQRYLYQVRVHSKQTDQHHQ